MKSYILLRANKELGPYLIDELKNQHLYNKDLVWIEGESTSWRLASEIDELKTAVKEPPEQKIGLPKKAPAAEFSSSSKPITSDTHQTISEPAKFPRIIDNTETDEPLFSLADVKQRPGKKNLKQQSSFSFNQNFLSLAILLAGAMAGAFVIKQMVDNFDDRQPSAVEAKEIESVDVPAITTSHTAQASNTLPAAETVQNNLAVKNDSFVHTVKINKALPALVRNVNTGNHKTLAKQDTNNGTAINTMFTANAVKQSNTNEKGKNSTPEVPKASVGAGSIEISANDYKVGLLGGVSGLTLSVTNSSGETAENVVVEVEFLKPNGSVAKSEIVQVQNIGPGSSKKIDVPSSSRGVKVRYRLVSTNAKESAVATDNM